MINLSYSLNGLAYEPVCKAISEIENAGFKGFEFSFNDQQLNPYRATDKYINDLINFLKTRDIKPVCISTATTFFLSTTPHEPSIISLDALSRSKRIELIKKGVDLAEKLNTPIVSFQSGYIRQENIENKDIKPIELLKSGIDEILTYIGNRKITLVIEPEPGMFIETIKEGVDLIKIINSDKFKLHMDIGHTYCTEDNYLEAIENNISYTGYMHLADIKSGHALRFRQIESLNEITSQPDDNDDRICSIGDNILYHNANTIWNFYEKLDPDVNASLKKLVPDVRHIALEELKYQKISDDLKTEVKAYTDSIPGISLKTLEKAGLALAYLRNGNNPIIKMAICNTVKGKVHYHERLGFGEIDLKACLKLIDKLEYDGFVTVELYNHTKMWEKVLPESYSFIQNFFTNYSKEAQHLIDEWGWSTIGDSLDHRNVHAPYIRLINLKETENQDWISTFDLRFVHPGKEEIESTTLHSLEHLLIKHFRRVLGNNYVLLAPMGCRTGFYLCIYGKIDRSHMILKYKETLEGILNEQFVPYQTQVQCGNYLDHDLDKAKFVVSKVIKNFGSIGIVM